MNYKDREQSLSVRQQKAVTNAALQTTSEVTQTLINAGNPTNTFGLSPWKIAGGILSAISKILWRTISNQKQWEEMIDAVEILIKKELNEQMYDEAITQLEGLQAVVDRYIKALDDLHANPTNQALQKEVLMRWNAADTAFIAAMPQFSPGTTGGDSQILLLAVYAQAANLHLLLLRDAVQFGEQWGMDPATIETNHDELLDRLNDYTDYCVNTYNKGLEKAKTLNATPCDYPWIHYNQGWREEEKPNCSPQQINDYDPQLNECHEQGNPYMGAVRWSKGEYQNLENWNLYNACRRDMTIMILDVVSLWPTYDPGLYPTSFGIKSELTRELYTDIRGTTYRSDDSQNTRDSIEERMIPTPHLFTWLNKLSFQLRQINGNGSSSDWTSGEIATGLQSTVQKTLATPEVLPLAGTTGTHTTTLNPLDYAEGITHINTQQWFEPRWFEFYSGGYNTELIFRNKFGTIEEKNPFWAAGPLNYIYRPGGRTSQIPEHRLSWIKYEPVRENAPFVYPQYKQLGAVALGWTHNSVDPNNSIASDKITQIPAVKANGIRDNASVVKGPGSTGGDLVQMSGFSVWTLPLTTRLLGKNYRVRIRYASSGDCQLIMRKWNTTGGATQTARHTVTATHSGGLNYKAFKYLDIFTITTTDNRFDLTMDLESGGNLSIYKIEFFPLTPEPEPPKPELPVPEGPYQIVTALNNSSVVDLAQKSQGVVGNIVQIYGNGYGTNQKWNLVYNASKDAYQIKNRSNENIVLTWISRDSSAEGVPNNSYYSQYWVIKDAGNGYFYLENYENSNLVLDVPNTTNGTKVLVKPFNGSTNQKFKFSPAT
ncbi:hypothetical protein DT250_24520 [Bacillus sp. AR2-1]|uniref:insecticidal delta-endotoxin Cry8Ea1 family protein n=1 Tax=Bacillus sp. AR2-1 TaxID=2217816 RepID=UPI0011ED2846|nr:insecticidal delta-endotoxin Cry8Ea1 family protein [Bacillus sp. AR2-1]KAA0760661.1 hypothetical protein DT250_24520 [Bacillus sp. AR2-1]